MVQDPPTLLQLLSTASGARDLTFRVKNIWRERRQMWRLGGRLGQQVWESCPLRKTAKSEGSAFNLGEGKVKRNVRNREMAQWLRALTALPEDLGLTLRTHRRLTT